MKTINYYQGKKDNRLYRGKIVLQSWSVDITMHDFETGEYKEGSFYGRKYSEIIKDYELIPEEIENEMLLPFGDLK